MKSRFFFLICLIFSICTRAQDNAIKGIVREEDKELAVPAASVFINGSTYGAICDEKGAFDIRQHPAFPFELVITAIGYESKTITVTAAAPLIIKLAPKVFDLGEVSVRAPEKDGWKKFGKTFLEEFIGYSAYAGECTLLNKNKLQFYWDQENMVLRVSADVPLKIKNKATGYIVTYWLEDFELNYITRKLYFRGYSQFEPLPSKRTKVADKWRSNRLKAYKGSLYHFMRSLYRGDALAEGFEIRPLIRMNAGETGKYVPVWSDTLSLSDTGKIKKLMADMYGPAADPTVVLQTLIRIKSWYADTSGLLPLRLQGNTTGDSTVTREFRFVKFVNDKEQMVLRYFEHAGIDTATVADARLLDDGQNNKTNMKITSAQPLAGAGMPAMHFEKSLVDEGQGQVAISPELSKMMTANSRKMVDMLFTDIVPPDSIIKHDTAGTTLHFKDYLHITYIHEAEEEEYHYRTFPNVTIIPDKQESIISIKPGKSILIRPGGNFTDSYDLFVERYWSYEKLDKLLPVDFEP